MVKAIVIEVSSRGIVSVWERYATGAMLLEAKGKWAAVLSNYDMLSGVPVIVHRGVK